MMPHERCQHSECWLQSFFTQRGITPPVYVLGQTVEVATYFENDDEDPWIRCDRGVIVGMVYNSPDFSPLGWVYTVRYESREDLTSAPWIKLPFDESLAESDLKAI